MTVKLNNSYKLFIALTLFFSVNINCFAQTENVREKVFIALNSHDLLVGETLHYSTTCLSQSTNRISKLSKYIYVELIGKDGVVFQRKHELSEGKASGDFFIPSDLETGPYYLVAYTRWMQNFGDLSKASIALINPYKDYSNPQLDVEPLAVQFGTTSGQLVAGSSNRVVLSASRGGKAVVVKGRVINQKGKVTDISTDANGLGHFEVSPHEDESLQLLIEDQNGGFEFFDLPQAIAGGQGLNISHTSNHISLQPIGAVHNGTLIVQHQGQLIIEKKIESLSAIRLLREGLPRDILTITFRNDKGIEQFTAPLFNAEVRQRIIDKSLPTRSFSSLEQELPAGHYSLSIRKSFSFSKSEDHAIQLEGVVGLSYSALQDASIFHPQKKPTLPSHVQFLPEYRYQILEGTIKAVDSNNSVKNRHVILSLTGEDDMNMAIARADSAGRFILEYETVNRGNLIPAHLTIPDFENAYSVEIKDNFIADHSLNFEPLTIDSSAFEDIKQRSIISQLENAYFAPITDTTVMKNDVPATIPYFNNHYEFDDYTRFPTLKEHFAEYIQVAGVRERKGLKRFVLFSLDEGFTFENDPMVFLDGVPVPMNEILEFSPYRIKSVDLFNRRYFLGSLVADGVLSFQTFEGNMGGFEFTRNHMVFDLLSPQPTPRNSISLVEANPRVPDTRIQLLWLPNFKVELDGPSHIQFETSGIEGEFEMRIEGFTTKGEPVSIINTFTVKELDNE